MAWVKWDDPSLNMSPSARSTFARWHDDIIDGYLIVQRMEKRIHGQTRVWWVSCSEPFNALRKSHVGQAP